MDVKTCIAQHDALLAEFASARAHELGDPFWNELLSFPVALTRLPPAELDAATTSYCEHLCASFLCPVHACASCGCELLCMQYKSLCLNAASVRLPARA